ncbi:MAG: rubrerythrin [Lachnospiraceae bacterium]|nr:rubrerythrin [Lachnospiraceae bacterium]
MKNLIKSQQGELDGVETYLKLAETVNNESDADTFRRLAADEGRHAAVFRQYTKIMLNPKKFQANAVSLLYSIFGKRLLYPIIAGFEYAAIPRYKKMMREYPDVEGVMNDEKRHGDTVKELLFNGEYNDKPLFPYIVFLIAALFVIKKIFTDS